MTSGYNFPQFGNRSHTMTMTWIRFLAACAALAVVQLAAATTVEVIALGPRSVDVVVDASVVRSLRVGQTSPEGIELVSVAPDRATLTVDGQRVELRLGETNRPAVVLRADSRGHYFATAHINGRAVDLLVDTGATGVILGADSADGLGIAYRGGRRLRVQTANGEVVGYAVTFDSVRVGNIALSGVAGAVVPAQGSAIPGVLGMSFLNRVQMIRSRDTLTLTR